MKQRYMYLFFVPIILLLFVFSSISQSASSSTNWRTDYQQAYKRLQEHQKYGKNKALLTKIEAELKSSEKTMTAAEQLLTKKPINKQVANSLVTKLDNHAKNLDNLTSSFGSESLSSTTLSSTDKTTQMTPEQMLALQSSMQTSLSNITKITRDMQRSIILNLR